MIVNNPILEVKKIIDEANFDWLDEIYVRYLPRDVQKETGKTIALITPFRESPREYGNNVFNSVENGVELQIFFKSNFVDSISQIDIKTMQLLIKNGWKVYDSKETFTDPDTKQIVKVFYFTKISNL